MRQSYKSVKINEAELLEKFGIEIVTLTSTMLLDEVEQTLNNDKEEVESLVNDWGKTFDVSEAPKDKLDIMAAIVIAMKKLADMHSCRAMTGDCWYMLQREYDIYPCFVWGILTDMGLPVACESDVMAEITSVLAQGVARCDAVPFVADLTIRHPTNDNAELLWHCGPFPPSLAKEGVKPKIFNGKGIWEIKGGDITLMRMGYADGKYTLFADTVKGTEGPGTNGNYLWVETEDWPAWEKKFVYGPYIHHVVGIHGKYKNIINECTKYIGNIEPDSVC